MNNYLETAKEIKKDYDFQITFEDYSNQECFEDLLEDAKRLKTIIIGVSIMKGTKLKNDEVAVKILDGILNDANQKQNEVKNE